MASDNVHSGMTWLMDLVDAGGSETLGEVNEALKQCKQLHAAYHHPENLKRETNSAAAILGWSRNTLYGRLKAWSLEPGHFRKATTWREVIAESKALRVEMKQLFTLLQTNGEQ